MTEQEAKTKWCPFARAPHLGTAGINRTQDDGPTPSSLCIGSACMAWRWDRSGLKMAWIAGRPALVPPESEEIFGFCGLAGKP